MYQVVTLQDIADRVGVTRTVVSYVLANRLGKIRVSEARREEILRVAAELGYVGNRSARALVTHKNRTLGLMVHQRRFEKLTVEAYATIFNILEGMRFVGSQFGYQSVHAVADMRSETVFEMPDFVRERSVDAIVVYGYIHPSVMKQLLATKLPCLHIGTNVEKDLGVPNVSTDMEGAICQVLDRAASAGMGMVHLYFPNGPGPKKIVDAVLGYVDKKHTRLQVTAAFSRGEMDYEEVLQHGKSLVKQAPSLVFVNISELLPLMVGLKSGGLQCPEDVQLVVFTSEGAHRKRLGETGLLISQIVLPNTIIGQMVSRQLIDFLEDKQPKLSDARIPCSFEPGETAPILSSLAVPLKQTK